jgi:alpha-L-fucosidase
VVTEVKAKASKKIARRRSIKAASSHEFAQVLTLVNTARARALAAVNSTLIDLHWQIGQYIERKIARDGWGKNTVEKLAAYIHRRQPNLRGFSTSNLWRMMQFYDTYRRHPNSHRWCENCPGRTTSSS